MEQEYNKTTPRVLEKETETIATKSDGKRLEPKWPQNVSNKNQEFRGTINSKCIYGASAGYYVPRLYTTPSV